MSISPEATLPPPPNPHISPEISPPISSHPVLQSLYKKSSHLYSTFIQQNYFKLHSLIGTKLFDIAAKLDFENVAVSEASGISHGIAETRHGIVRILRENQHAISHTLAAVSIVSVSYVAYSVTSRFLSFLGIISPSHRHITKHLTPSQQGQYWYNQGYHYYINAQNESDREKALKCFVKAAKYNHPLSLLHCALFYKNGTGCEKNDQMAFKYFQRCVEHSDDPVAHFQLGEYYSRGFDETTHMVQNGRHKKKRVSDVSRTRGSNRNLKKAFHHYKMAARKGAHVEAMMKLAACYDFGYSVDVSPEKAFQWYLRAAQAGSGSAARELALRYENGVGCEADREQARLWRERYDESGMIR